MLIFIKGLFCSMIQSLIKIIYYGASLVVQWLRIHLVMQGDTGSIPGWGRSHMTWGITSQPTWRDDGSPLTLEWGSANRDAAAVRSPCAAAGK